MSRGKSKSPQTRSERIETASDYFRRGYSDSDVARKLKIARQTAAAYRVIYEQRLKEKTADDPAFLQDVVGNTNRMLSELDQIIRNVWKDVDQADKKIKIRCDNCEEISLVVLPDLDLKAKLYGLALKAQQDRSKLYGVIGVKAEVIAKIQAVEFVQNALLKFMAEKLCQHDREALVEFLTSPALAPYMGGQAGVIEAESWEDEAINA